MEEEKEGNSIHKVPDHGVTPLSTEVKPRGNAQTTSDQLVARDATESVTWTPTRLLARSSKAGTKQGHSEVATCKPTRHEDSPSEGSPGFVPSPVLPVYTEEAGSEPEYEHPFWTLLYETRYRPW